MSGTRVVRAVLVTDGRSPRLPAVLAALAAQTTQPDFFHLHVLADADAPDVPPALKAEVTWSPASTFAQGVERVLAEHSAHTEDELLWLLHDDTAPAPEVLQRLEATSRKRPRAAVVGAMHVRWDDPARIVNVGTTVSTWGARRVGLAAEDDINQGQYDTKDDVLAVSLAGALVSREAWETLGGLDAGYRGFGDSVEFCRRVWAWGHDVVVVPTAKIRHAQESLYDRRGGGGLKRATHAQRRAGEWYHALTWAPWWAIPLLALVVVPSAAVRAVVRIMQNHPGLVAAELGVPLMVLGSAPRIALSRRARTRITVDRSAEGRLLANFRQVVSHVRERELGGWEQWRAERAPTDVERSELAARKRATARSMLVVLLAGTAVSLAVTARYVSDLLSGSMLTAPGAGATDTALGTLWERVWTGWSDAGLGSPALDGAFASLFVPAAAVWGDSRLAIGLLLSFAPLVAGLGAWWALGAATRVAWLRTVLALAYALWPLFLAAALDARVGAVIAHVALPWVAWGVARAAGWARSDAAADAMAREGRRRPSASAALLAAVALAVVTTAAPSLLVPAVMAIGVLGAFAGRTRWRVWTVPVLSLVIAAPALVAAARQGGAAVSVLWREPGPSAAFEPLDSWEILLGADGGERWAAPFQPYAALAYLPGVMMIALAVAAVVVARTQRSVVLGWGIAALGILGGVIAQSTVAAWPDQAGAAPLRGWPGTGSSLAILALAAAVAIAFESRRAELPAKPRLRRALVTSVASLGVVVVCAPVVFLAWPGAGQGLAVASSPDVLPLAVPLDLNGAARQRALVVSADSAGIIEFSVLSSDGTEYVSGRAFTDSHGAPLARRGTSPGGPAVLAPVVAALASGGAADTSVLAAWGVGIVVVAPGSDRVKAALDANEDLTLVGGSERGTTYRVGTRPSAGPIARAWLETTEGTVTLDSSDSSGRVELPDTLGGVLVIAVEADPAWRASLDGNELTPTTDELGRQAFAVPSGGGELSYEYRDDAHRLWFWASAAATAWALLGAIPLGARGLREHTS